MAATKTTRKTIVTTASIDAAKVARDKAYRAELLSGAHEQLGYSESYSKKLTNDDILAAYIADGFSEAELLDALAGQMGYPIATLTPLCVPALTQLWIENNADKNARAEAKAEEAAQQAAEAQPEEATEAPKPEGRRAPSVDNELNERRRTTLIELLRSGQYDEAGILEAMRAAFPGADHGTNKGMLKRAQKPGNRIIGGGLMAENVDGRFVLFSK